MHIYGLYSGDMTCSADAALLILGLAKGFALSGKVEYEVIGKDLSLLKVVDNVHEREATG